MTPDTAARREQKARALDAALAAPEAAQEALLLAIAREHSGTAFGRAHDLGRVRSLADWRAAVPCRGYEAFRPDIEAMLGGARDLLFPGAPIFFARTSGSSGQPKHVAYPANVQDEYLGVFDPMFAALEADHPGAMGAALVISGTYDEGTAPCGVTVGSASGFVRRLPAFADEAYWHLLPEPVWQLADFEARYYAMLRVALARPLRLLNALNPSSVLTVFSKAEQYGSALVEDLKAGTLDAGPPAARAVAGALGGLLAPAPAAAARLSKCLAANGAFLPREVWPDLQVIQTWKGGSAAHYLASLRERCPGVPIRPAVSGSTEGLLMTPLRGDGWMGGVPALLSSVLEFFPEDKEPTADAFVPVSELAEGVGWRIALSNRRGMYRYLIDDVFVVEGRVHRTPVLRFSHRHGLTSSLTGEKLTEPQVAQAVEEAAAGLAVADFQVGPEWGSPPCYLLLLELEVPLAPARLEALLRDFEAALGRQNVEYVAKRSSQRLAHPQLLVLAKGEFERMRREKAQARQGSDAQVKIPRLRRELIERASLRIERVVRGERAS